MILLNGCVMLANGLSTVGSLGHIPHLESIVTTTRKHSHVILREENERKKEKRKIATK